MEDILKKYELRLNHLKSEKDKGEYLMDESQEEIMMEIILLLEEMVTDLRRIRAVVVVD